MDPKEQYFFLFVAGKLKGTKLFMQLLFFSF